MILMKLDLWLCLPIHSLCWEGSSVVLTEKCERRDFAAGRCTSVYEDLRDFSLHFFREQDLF